MTTRWVREQQQNETQHNVYIVLASHSEEIADLKRQNADLVKRDAEREREIARLKKEIQGLKRTRVPEHRGYTSASRAGKRLGCSTSTVRRLIESGELGGAVLQLPDRERRMHVVEDDDLDRFERDHLVPVAAHGGAVGAPGAVPGAAKPAAS